ncbi:MAG: hypothetical protein LBU32_33230 [Clostridiales bacterium]|jgi:hypothetical protein|nr:hypothetical protein [Clostridiales bacterium]
MRKELCSIRFRNGDLGDLRASLSANLNREQFAVLLGKAEDAGAAEIVAARDVIYPSKRDIEDSSIASLRINRNFVAETLKQMTDRLDADAYIEVHTHPFSKGLVVFSGADGMDEKRFSDYTAKEWPGIEYASAALSQTMHGARFWHCGARRYSGAAIKTQLAYEAIYKKTDQKDIAIDSEQSGVFNRGMLALGLES